MNLTRLQELTASTKKTSLTEGTKHDKAFIGIARIIDDSLGDLKDKLGKGGSLQTLMKDSGATKLDKVKGASGKTIGKEIIELTTEYCRAIEKLMVEAEILVTQMNEGRTPTSAGAKKIFDKVKGTPNMKASQIKQYVLKYQDMAGVSDKDVGSVTAEVVSMLQDSGLMEGLRLDEGKDYEDSTDFTEEFFKLDEHVNAMKAVMKNPRWMKWMKVTDTNFGTECEASAVSAISALNDLEANLNDVEDELDKAS